MTVRATYYATVKLGPKRSLTPEGFLLCEEVPLARTGLMIYGPDETPIEPAKNDEVVRITRGDEDLFNPQTLGSANGKSVTVQHPEEDVTPANVKELEVGVCLSPRRGTGALDDLLLGDLLIKAPEGIDAIMKQGIEEISLGYDADYEQTAPGHGRQTNIIINHIALVEEGRCGPRCAIGDQKPKLNEVKTMSKRKGKVLDFLQRAFKAKDAAELEGIAEEARDELGIAPDGSDGDTHIHVHTAGQGGAGEPAATQDDDQLQQFMEQNAQEHEEFRQQIAALQQQVNALTNPASGAQDEELPDEALDEMPEELQAAAESEGKDKAKDKVKDSAPFRDSFQDTVAMAEILVPGIQVPTFDSAAKPLDTYKRICGLRCTALDAAYAVSETRAIIDQILAGKKLDTKRMTCDAVRTLFRSAAAMKRVANNGGAAANGGTRDSQHQQTPRAPMSLAEINRLHAEYWAKH